MSLRAKPPVHLWIIGVIALLWNLMGAFDYTMTQTRNADYLAQFTQEQLDYYDALPAWFVFFWALAVWGALAGSILLLLRKRLAVPVFAAAFVSMVLTTIYSFALSDGLKVMGVQGLVFTIVIFVVALFLVLYARAMAAKSVLA